MAKKEAEKITAKSDYERDFAKYKAALARTEASKEQPK